MWRYILCLMLVSSAALPAMITRPVTADVESRGLVFSATPPSPVGVCQVFAINVSLYNTGDSSLTAINISAFLPKGFRYVNNSAYVDLRPSEPEEPEDTLRWNIMHVEPDQSSNLTFRLRPGPDVEPYEHINIKIEVEWLNASGARNRNESNIEINVYQPVNIEFGWADKLGQALNISVRGNSYDNFTVSNIDFSAPGVFSLDKENANATFPNGTTKPAEIISLGLGSFRWSPNCPLRKGYEDKMVLEFKANLGNDSTSNRINVSVNGEYMTGENCTLTRTYTFSRPVKIDNTPVKIEHARAPYAFLIEGNPFNITVDTSFVSFPWNNETVIVLLQDIFTPGYHTLTFEVRGRYDWDSAQRYESLTYDAKFKTEPILGGVGLLVIALALVFLLLFRRTARRSTPSIEPSPAVEAPDHVDIG